MLFENGGDKKVFISSADWMTRNMDQRIEVGAPIYSKRLIEQVENILDMQFRDTLKARVINKEQSNPHVNRGNRRHLRSQIEIYEYLQRIEQDTLQLDESDQQPT